MADGFQRHQDTISCSVCLDVLKDPVSLHCGHNYCMVCIEGFWDKEHETGLYSCPQCRQIFTPRPVLCKNPLIAEMVEQLRRTRLQAASPAPCYAEPGDVECDVCTGRKLKAVKSCLVCLLSYCETHFNLHDQLIPRGAHMVTDATGRLQERICPQHSKIFEIFCRTDQTFICYLCMTDQHKNHDTVSVAAERTEKQQQLKKTQENSWKKVQQREKELQELRRSVEALKNCAEDHQKVLEEEITELNRRDAELQQLSHTEDNIFFLQKCSVFSAPLGSKGFPSIAANKSFSFKTAANTLDTLKQQLENVEKVECGSGGFRFGEQQRFSGPSTRNAQW
ncbi:E3 ubiquitin/ISG15 ligase TRIM25-like [Denticeps clupeoides]|uniref:E3 ubiquitin/ISG15 ligase TRIM25-like n=1 Tax=Denticeps clupeoides TaxID=299321 RepID=UPI0010A4FC44|nr:E3 ubiquitin/ISG15 ligase TRIM25-like [Denticeps clupeoides]